VRVAHAKILTKKSAPSLYPLQVATGTQATRRKDAGARIPAIGVARPRIMALVCRCLRRGCRSIAECRRELVQIFGSAHITPPF
jgi:hypothetical protein